jgi:hypothetical protein
MFHWIHFEVCAGIVAKLSNNIIWFGKNFPLDVFVIDEHRHDGTTINPQYQSMFYLVVVVQFNFY